MALDAGLHEKQLDPGRCRFNCRTAKANWIEGYIGAAMEYGRQPMNMADMTRRAEEAHREWKGQQ